MADKSAHKAKTRARILGEAAGAMRMAGVQGIGVSALMQRAGLTHGGFYAHFESRDDLVAHAVDRMFEESAMILDRFLGERPDLSGLIDHYLSESAYRAADRGCPLPGLSGEAARMPPAARLRFEAGVRRFREGIARALEIAGRSDGAALAHSLLAELVGAMTLARAMSDEGAALDFLASSRDRLKERIDLA
ncbi:MULTISPECIES: TetR/AcrR family transcriptional regulator [Sphingobium]|uniref:TetR/AcrR family transcriptional regulator n=1 Tax=Sphingobium fuliginis ATCC 27551 TaxID=1208342 RepID=A0A5B8CMM4_SPHSA|nr:MULTISPECIES: TetR/AcrR family transcriptional regulator [Sphingobium]MCB4860250.1 TetR/AcrR family transcriptional regulator [Sphingobium sp. PNB]QDC39898.1 TetR/AcrR family transcriptional regulator [Sphingobium fuliginis ATCC 27551]